MSERQYKQKKLLRAESAIRHGRKRLAWGLRSADLHDPPINLEKGFELKGHFFPQDDIFPAD